jgi:hypothetical protein
MTVLLAVGVALVLFGALVLLRFPDRPGGRIGWQGFEVSSLGAGLPIIALGVVAIGFASVRGVGDGEGSPRAGALGVQESTAASDAVACFQEVPEDELRTIEEGTNDFDLVRADQPKADPVWIAFTDGGAVVGGLRFRFFPANTIFKIERLVDRRCEPLEPVANTSRGGNPRVLQNWDTVRLRFDDALYDLRIGASSDIELNYFVRVQE